MRNLMIFLSVTIIGLWFGCVSPGYQDSIEASDLDYTEFAEEVTSKYGLIEGTSNRFYDSILAKENEIPLNRNDLEKMRTVVKTYSGSANAGITVPGFGGIKLANNETSLSVYYIETKVVNNENDSVVYGCGYSVHYLFKKIKRGLDLSDLPSISASVHLENNKTQVFYSIQTYGIIGQNLVRYFKPTVNKKFDVEGFGIMQSSIDGIHNILGDSVLSSSVRFRPEILKFIKPYELEQL